jgi:hypothetical protein
VTREYAYAFLVDIVTARANITRAEYARMIKVKIELVILNNEIRATWLASVRGSNKADDNVTVRVPCCQTT